MAKVFYDRSGKAHVLGEKTGNQAGEKSDEKGGEKPSPGGKKLADRLGARTKMPDAEEFKKPTGRAQKSEGAPHEKKSQNKPNKRKFDSKPSGNNPWGKGKSRNDDSSVKKPSRESSGDDVGGEGEIPERPSFNRGGNDRPGFNRNSERPAFDRGSRGGNNRGSGDRGFDRGNSRGGFNRGDSSRGGDRPSFGNRPARGGGSFVPRERKDGYVVRGPGRGGDDRPKDSQEVRFPGGSRPDSRGGRNSRGGDSRGGGGYSSRGGNDRGNSRGGGSRFGTSDRGARGNERGGRGNDRGNSRGGGATDRGGNTRGEARRATPVRGGVRPRPNRAPNPDWIQLKGIIDKNKKGSAFLIFDRRDLEDVFIPRYYVEQLFHGDRVEVYISEQGEIEDLKVLEHRFKHIFGRITLNDSEGRKTKQEGRTGFLIYERKKAKEEVYVPTVPNDVQEGDWVKAEVVFSEEGGSISATITEVIGQELPPSFDIQMVAGEFNLTEHHTFEAVKQAESYKLEIPGKDEEGRTDLRHIPFMTIDGERARDFDDAVFVENLGRAGFRLWVAIADVSHYVKVGTPLDDEAYKRGTSVYFPERAFHMLPRALSEELCSLKPNVPRLGMAMSADFAANGDKTNIQVYDVIIQSRRRATYTEIEAEKEDPKHKDLFGLYRILKKKRSERGSIDFDFPEAEIILDEKSGDPKDIVVRERVDAHRLIEEFMIVANESVTEWMLSRSLPFIYRVHDEPSMEAIEKFRKLAKNMGVPLLSKGGVPRPKVLAEFIRTLKDHPAEPILATGLLRSMRQAIYSATHGEHYGLASEAYTHFTSPIRRYPDLVVHRQLRATLHREQNHEKPLTPEEEESVQESLNQIAEHCSYRERVASEAERESIRFKQVRLMAKHLGEEFEGKVNGLHMSGMYVQLHHPYCEGMVPLDSIKDDWYEFIEERMQIMGRKTKRMFTIGQIVKIQVVRVDLDARQVEFNLVVEGKKKKVKPGLDDLDAELGEEAAFDLGEESDE